MIKNYPYSRQKVSNQDIKAVVNVMKSDMITQGPVVKIFMRITSDLFQKVGKP